MGGKCDNKEGDKSSEHPFPQISRYKRERERESNIMEVRGTCIPPQISSSSLKIYWLIYPQNNFVVIYKYFSCSEHKTF